MEFACNEAVNVVGNKRENVGFQASFTGSVTTAYGSTYVVQGTQENIRKGVAKEVSVAGGVNSPVVHHRSGGLLIGANLLKLCRTSLTTTTGARKC